MHMMYQVQALDPEADGGTKESRKSAAQWKAVIAGAHEDRAGVVRR
jgi:hypothetical protein